jgi:hypothetical protein
MPNKGRRIKADGSNPSHLFSSLFSPNAPLRHSAIFPVVVPSRVWSLLNEILHFYHHFCRTLCGRGICPVDG